MTDKPDVPPSAHAVATVRSSVAEWYRREGYIFPAYAVLLDLLAREIDAAVLAERERCASLHESISPDCDHDLGNLGPTSHPGGMGIVIRYRDAIRKTPAQ